MDKGRTASPALSSSTTSHKRQRDDAASQLSQHGPREGTTTGLLPLPLVPAHAKPVPKAKARAKASNKSTKAAAGKKPAKRSLPANSKTRARHAAADDAEFLATPEPEDVTGVQQADATDEEEDTRLYCICQQIYNPERMMIACDRCDEWYHLDCILVDEDDVELINDFVCPPCESTTAARTTWKTRCARRGCNKAAVALSKFCSDWCGIEVAAERLEKTSIEPARYWPVVSHVHKPIARVAHARPVSSPPSNETSLQSRLVELSNKRSRTEAQIALVDARLRFLAIAVRRWDVLRSRRAMADHVVAPQAEDPDPATAPKKARSKKGKSRSKTTQSGATEDAEASCCFDVRLVWDDADWDAWVQSGELEREEERPEGVVDDQVVCMLSRRQCDRHAGWQRLHEASFRAEKAGEMRKLDHLAAQERKIRLGLDDLNDATRVRGDAGYTESTERSATIASTVVVDVNGH